MLILSRKVDERIVIETSDGPITVMVVSIRHGGKVRLGIEAPNHVAVNRKEVYDAIARVYPQEQTDD